MFTKIAFYIKHGLLRQEAQDLAAEQIVYLNQHRERELARGVGYYNKLGLFGYVLGTAAIYFVGHPKLKLIAMLWTSTLALECLIWIFAERFVKPHKRELMVTLRGSFLIISCLVCCAFFFDSVFKDPQFTPDYYVMAGLILEIIGWGIGAATLLYGHLVVMFLCVLPLITLLPSVSERSSNQVGLFILALLPNVCIGGYFFVETKIRRRLALVEFNAQQLSMQNELLKRQTIERELEIARAVQDAFQSPVGTKKSGNHEIDFFHVPYGILGGDWLAERELPDGRQVVVVADVTGKGIPAAMVVQCVQSLWAASLAEPQFDADKWLQSLNQALCTLGRTQGTHSVSMGVMVLAGSHCTYFSAGHVPMYFARDIHDHRSIVPINARGSVLGLDPLVTFQPEIIALPAGEPYILMLGTDGILDWQTRRSGRAVQRIIRGALDEGMSAIAKHPVSDDKIMIIIRAA